MAPPAPPVVQTAEPSVEVPTASAEEDPRRPLPDGSVLEQYTILKRLGQGGFGITYRARHTEKGTIVVIKEHMPRGLAIREADSDYVISVSPEMEHGFRATMDEFLEEVVVLQGLEHSGIVPILHSFETNGTAYYVMPYMEGSPLAPPERPTLDKVSRRREARTIRLQLYALLETLAYLESHNIVHRDIKPENILVTSDGQPVLLDFGSARQLQPGKVFTNIYTPDFCAPEQALSATDSEMSAKLGPWTDLYALGASFHYLITRLMPPRAEMRGYAEADPYKPLSSRADLVRLYGEPFLQAIDRALEIRVTDRWQNAADWRDGITRGIMPPPPRLVQRMRFILAGSAVLLLVFGGISLWALKERDQAMQIYNQSLHFTEDILYDFNEELTDVPGATNLQGQLVTRLKNYLDGMEELPIGHDEKVQRALSSAWRNLGYIYTERGDLEASTEALLRATELQSALVEAYPDNLNYRYNMARTWLYRAEVARRRNLDDTATSLLSQAMLTLRDLCAKSPGNPEYTCALGKAIDLTATLARVAGNRELHAKAVEELLALYRHLNELYPNNVDARMGLANALMTFGNLAMDEENFSSAALSYEEARQIFTELGQSSPYLLSFKKGLASTYYALGTLRMRISATKGDAAERLSSDERALEDFMQHLKLAHELTMMDPGNAEYPFLQCRTMGVMVDILLRLGNDKLAEAYSRSIVEKTSQLLATAPDNAEYAMLKAAGLRGLAVSHSRSDKHRERGGREFKEARDIMETLLNRAPDNRAMLLVYVNILRESADYALNNGREDSAREWLQRAQLIISNLIRANGDNKLLPNILNGIQEKLDSLHSAD